MKRQTRVKWALPTVIDPPVRKCIQVYVPDDPMHIAAFRGAMLNLASALAWDDDTAHTAREVALVWREIVDGMVTWGCGDMSILFRQPSPCILEYSTDEGENWNVAGVFEDCAEGVAQDLIDQMLDDGSLSAGGQQPPQPRPSTVICKTYNVRLDGDGFWFCPVPLYAGDSIEVKTAEGGWWDGGEFSWRCPSGAIYGLGECSGDPELFTGDPASSVGHMRLIGFDGTNYRDMYLIKFTPTNTIPRFVLQANDSNINNNKGSINLTVEVCTNAYQGDCASANRYLPYAQTDYCYTGDAPPEDLWHDTGIAGEVQFNPPPTPGYPRAFVIDLRQTDAWWPNKSGAWQVKINGSSDLRLFAEEIRTGPCDRTDKIPIQANAPIDPATWYTIPANKPLMLIQSGSDGMGQINTICVQ